MHMHDLAITMLAAGDLVNQSFLFIVKIMQGTVLPR